MITPEQLTQQLTKGLAPCYLCFGDEPERLQSSIDSIWQTAKHVGFDERQVVVIESASDWQEFFFSYQEQSLFARMRVMQVHLSAKMTAAQSEKMQQLVNAPNPDVILVFRAGALDRQAQESKWVKAIETVGCVVNSKALQGRPLIDWLMGQAKQLNMEMMPDAAQWLAHWSEGNLLAAKQSLLRWQLQGVTMVDHQLLDGDQQDWARFDVFALVDAVSHMNVLNSVRIYDRLVDEGEDAVLILWSLSREVRLWQTLLFESQQKSWSQIVSDHRLWRDRAERLQRLLKQITPAMVSQWQTALLKIDKIIKGQGIGDAYLSLRWMVADLASAGKVLPSRLSIIEK
jgi:DNA polymerase-3 subunit delta